MHSRTFIALNRDYLYYRLSSISDSDFISTNHLIQNLPRLNP